MTKIRILFEKTLIFVAVMWILILILTCGMVLGYLTRQFAFAWVHYVVTCLIWSLLFILGLEVGANESVVNDFYRLGGSAILVAVCGLIGSMLAACGVQWWVKKSAYYDQAQGPVVYEDESAPSVWGGLIIVAWFFLGVVLSLWRIFPIDVLSDKVSFLALCLLLVAVGFSVGHDPAIKEYLRQMHGRLLLLPLMTILGTLVGVFVLGMLWHKYAVADVMATGAGLGYYSLSSILVTQYKGAELGTVALLANVIRELITLLAAPWIVRFIGPLALVSSGGATSMDTTLAVVSQYAGRRYVGLSIIHGLCCDFSVPFVVTLLVSM